MNRDLSFWSGLIAFQVVFGMSVFLVTRDIYRDGTSATSAVSDAFQGEAQRPPHAVPRAMAIKRPALLPGSERITADDAQRLAATVSSGGAWPGKAASNTSAAELSQIADRHFREGLFQQAAVEYAEILKQAPHNVDVYNNLGLTLHYVGRSRKGVETLEKGIGIDANHQRSWLTLGFVQYRIGDTEAARRALSRAVELDGESTVGREAKRLLGELP